MPIFKQKSTRKKYLTGLLVLASVLLIADVALVFFGRSAKNEPGKILLVVSPIEFSDEEYFTAREVFENAGIAILTASIQSGIAKSSGNKEVVIDTRISDINTAEYAGVVFIGGAGMEQIYGDDSLRIMAIRFKDAGKLVAAIDGAPAVLASAGVLKGIKATSNERMKNILEEGGAVFLEEKVVVDNGVVTASEPDVSKEFGEEILRNLYSKD